MLRSFAIACLISASVVAAPFRFAPLGHGQRGPQRREMPAHMSRGGNQARPSPRGRISARGSSERARSSRGPSRGAPSRMRSTRPAPQGTPSRPAPSAVRREPTA